MRKTNWLGWVALFAAWAILLFAVVEWSPAEGLQTQPAAHAVTLSWTASLDATAANPGANNVYRAAGACSASSAFAAVATNVAGTSYKDTGVAAGQSYCYQVTFVLGGLESAPSNEVSVTVKPFPPTGLAASAD